jgi:hypothetical protein
VPSTTWRTVVSGVVEDGEEDDGEVEGKEPPHLPPKTSTRRDRVKRKPTSTIDGRTAPPHLGALRLSSSPSAEDRGLRAHFTSIFHPAAPPVASSPPPSLCFLISSAS